MRTLYIIGNGFDLAHNLPTSYEDFRNWLIVNKQQYFIENLEWFFSRFDRIEKKDLLWQDFERALGLCNFEKTYEMFANQSREYFGEGTEYLRDISNTSDEHFSNPIRYEMPDLFTRWVESINERITKMPFVPQEQLILKHIKEVDLFLTFNYTDTLEYIYGIPSSNICYIHNSVSEGEQPIVGHNTTFQITIPDDMTRAESELKQSLANILNSIKKDYKSNIKREIHFFDQINHHVDTICFYGHSLGDIDLPYFMDIKKRVSPITHWVFFIYPGDKAETLLRNKKSVLDFIKKMRLEERLCKAYDSTQMNHEIPLK